MASTEYVVLHKTSEGRWEEVGTVAATGAMKAARTIAEKVDVGGEYVAVPTRSFASVLVEFETSRRARISVVQEEIPEFPEKKKEEEPAKS